MTLSPALASFLDGVDGFLHPDEPAFLASLAAEVPAGQQIVEIGAYQGRSTIALATGARDGVLVYSIDPHDEHEAGGFPFGMADNQRFMANVATAGLGYKVRVLNVPSNTAVVMQRHALVLPIGLLFVDGAHDYDSVHADVFRWLPFISYHGKVAIHDSAGTWDAPTNVANELKTFDGWTEVEGCAYTRCFQSAPVMDGKHS